jgi:hypothetical protein
MTDVDRIKKFNSSIFTTDEELLDLLSTKQLKFRLSILRGYDCCPLRYRVVLSNLIASR